MNGEYPFFTSGKRILEYNSYLVDNRNIYLNTGGNADVKYYIGKASYSTDTWCITTKNNLTNYCYLFLKNIQNEIDAIYFEGSALKHLQKKKLLEKKIYIPNIQETQNLNEILDPLFEIISKNTFQNRYLSFLRDALLSKLMSGEFDISEIDI
ncbi:restriction endonuclease subunit S [Fusobacterium nucleatum]|uniref:restriction endonuclease subunit S n=1 Tax=Fusobacterium nucleatum TaxID=851 RepID=UPI003CCAF9BD